MTPTVFAIETPRFEFGFVGDGVSDCVRVVAEPESHVEVSIDCRYAKERHDSARDHDDLPDGDSPGSLPSRDGALDLVAVASREREVQVFRGDGAGGFSAETYTEPGKKIASVRAADFDGDGRLDIASATTSGNQARFVLAHAGRHDGLSYRFELDDSSQLAGFQRPGASALVGGLFAGEDPPRCEAGCDVVRARASELPCAGRAQRCA